MSRLLAADHRRVLPRRARTRSRAGARWEAPGGDPPPARRARDRARARPGRGRRPARQRRRARRWLGGRGRNIPSFELFTSPDWRGTEGWIYCNQPLYRYGNLVKGIRLAFVDGRVSEASAEQNEQVLKEMIATEGADRIGEFSLTDRRFSRITRFMAQTLYDENFGGAYGNTHIALGRSYQDAYAGDPASVERRGVAAAWLQHLERPHRRRLDQRSRRHRHAARRRGARDLPRRRVPARLIPSGTAHRVRVRICPKRMC